MAYEIYPTMRGRSKELDNQQSSASLVETRVCTRCKQTKPLNEFYIQKKGKRPGLSSSACKTCESERMKAYYSENKGKKKVWFSERYKRLKDAVFNAYGGYQCACCGEDEPLFLTIDHIEGNGSRHRMEMTPDWQDYRDYRSATGYKTYRWLERHNYPLGFQVLCSNCNHGRQRNGGICPHKRFEGSPTIS